jgi:bacteriorhodopsin
MQIISVKNSFYFTYVFLITTGVITFIEALRNPIPQIRHIMNLETCISIIAGYFYGVFIELLDKSEEKSILTQETQITQKTQLTQKTQITNEIKKTEEKENESSNTPHNELNLPIEKINDMRYSDWIISTPLMLLVLSLVLGYENKVDVHFLSFSLVLFFNFLMLGFGYIGEINLLNRTLANFIGFIFFFLTYGTIWKQYMTSSKVTKQSKIIFWIYLGLWSLYGVFYQTNEKTKMIGYNILDLLAKAFVGLFFWLYLTKIVKF